MEEPKGHAYAWSISWIDFTAPNSLGIYWLRDKQGKALFVGTGNVRTVATLRAFLSGASIAGKNAQSQRVWK